MQREQEPSEREICGVFKYVVDAKPHCNQVQLNFVNAAADWAIRHKIQEEHPHHVDAVMNKFVSALELMFKQIKAKEHTYRVAKFYRLHSGRLRLVFGDDIKKICDNLHQPKVVKDQLYAAVKLNPLGKILFDDVVQTLISEEVTAAVLKSLEAYNGKHLTEELYEEAKAAALKAGAAADTGKICRPRRKVWLKYRGVDVSCRVVSFLSEVELQLQGMIREVAVKAKQLDPLVFEEDLIDKSKDIVRLEGAAASLTYRAQAAREIMNAFLTAFDPDSGALLEDLIATKDSRANNKTQTTTNHHHHRHYHYHYLKRNIQIYIFETISLLCRKPNAW